MSLRRVRQQNRLVQLGNM